MKITISQNIRAFRKERRLTQEQLAEAMGVTVGTVSKWESASSVPDITLIVELADFFETSVDVLLGYGWHGGSMSKAVERICELRNEKRFEEAAAEAEKALQKYPNSFEVAYQGALQYVMGGIEQGGKRSFERALQLYERSLELIRQNTDEEISEMSIKNAISRIYIGLGRSGEALEIMKRNNSEGVNNCAIGLTLATAEQKAEEALPYLSAAMIDWVIALQRMTSGYSSAYCQLGRYDEALSMLKWAWSVLEGLRRPDVISYYDKQSVWLLCACAQVSAQSGDEGLAKDYLRMALTEARRFDLSPSFNFENTPYFHCSEPKIAFDDFGQNAAEGIEHFVEKDERGGEILERAWRAVLAEEAGRGE